VGEDLIQGRRRDHSKVGHPIAWIHAERSRRSDRIVILGAQTALEASRLCELRVSAVKYRLRFWFGQAHSGDASNGLTRHQQRVDGERALTGRQDDYGVQIQLGDDVAEIEREP